jgi:multiple sugar transport system substrate-binding protein
MQRKLISLFILLSMLSIISFTVAGQDDVASVPVVLTLPEQIAEGRPVTITVSNMPASDQAELRTAWEEQAARFMALYPNVTINGIELQYDPAAYVALAAGNQLPTLFMTYFTEPSKFIPQGVAADLTAYFEASNIAGVFNPAILDITSADGAIYGIPLNAYALGLAYNIEMLAEAGIEVPTTWEELAVAAQALTDRDAGVSGFAFINDGSGATGWHFTNIAYGFGATPADFIALNEDGSYTAEYGEGAPVEALEYVSALRWEYDVLPGATVDWGSLSEALIAERVAMAIYAGDQFNYVYLNFPDADLNKFGYAPTPAGEHGSVSLIGGNVYMVSASADADQQEAATYYQLWRQFDPAEVLADLEATTSAMGQPILPLYVGEYQEALEAFREPYNVLPVENYALFNEAVKAGEVTLQPELITAVQEYYSEIGIVVSEVLSNRNVDIAERLATSEAEFQAFVLD